MQTLKCLGLVFYLELVDAVFRILIIKQVFYVDSLLYLFSHSDLAFVRAVSNVKRLHSINYNCQDLTIY